jgi:hypothetical protein
LLYLLLQKDPSKRLGSPSTGGLKGLQSHPFFNELDWDRVARKDYDPPIKPKVKNQGDTRHISKMFLS